MRELIRNGWSYHDSESERLAQELEKSEITELVEEDQGPCLRLSNHTIGEHLRDWPRARRFAEHVCGVHVNHLNWRVAGAHLAVARYMDGALGDAQQAEIDCIAASDDPVSALLGIRSILAGALAGTGNIDQARSILEAANKFASGRETSTCDREMAMVNNNVATDLINNQNLDERNSQFMRNCALAALKFWNRCGTWVHKERALYLLSLVSNRLSEYQSGLNYAQSALEVIAANGEDKVDECFIRLAAARAYKKLGSDELYADELAQADAIAKEWSDELLVKEYRDTRLKLVS